MWRPQSPAKPDLFTVNLAPPEPRLDGLWCSAGTAPPPQACPSHIPFQKASWCPLAGAGGSFSHKAKAGCHSSLIVAGKTTL